MKKRTLSNLILGKTVVSNFDAITAIKGGATITNSTSVVNCQPEPSGGDSQDILCPSGPLPTKGCGSNEPSNMCPV